ncbi:MAG: hypothetical protein FWD57_05335 [Polyangiaceae bacterium]|nr:hypothetical protein [Polyangiaceae bacterium]
MKARAPGKAVISGAYAVLEGAPAIVTAINRYVVADTSLPASFESPEARAAIPVGPLPHVDVTDLRIGDRKLGIGSSAAIVVASLAALELESNPDLLPNELADRVWKPAVVAHKLAQGGGSGIDVVTCAYGGTRLCWIEDGVLCSKPHQLPSGMAIDIYSSRDSCSTSAMLELVRAWATKDPARYRQLMSLLSADARAAAAASDIDDYVEATWQQLCCLSQLGVRAGAPILPEWLHLLAVQALSDGVAIHPSGAGGGDIVLCMGWADGCEQWKSRLEAAGLVRLDVRVGAAGVHRFCGSSLDGERGDPGIGSTETIAKSI